MISPPEQLKQYCYLGSPMSFMLSMPRLFVVNSVPTSWTLQTQCHGIPYAISRTEISPDVLVQIWKPLNLKRPGNSFLPQNFLRDKCTKQRCIPVRSWEFSFSVPVELSHVSQVALSIFDCESSETCVPKLTQIQKRTSCRLHVTQCSRKKMLFYAQRNIQLKRIVVR